MNNLDFDFELRNSNIKKEKIETKKRIKADLMYLDFDIRELFVTYLIKLEAKLRKIWSEGNPKVKKYELFDKSLKSVIIDISKSFGTYSDKVLDLFNSNLSSNARLKDDDIRVCFDFFRFARNYVAHGDVNLFGFELSEELVRYSGTEIIRGNKEEVIKRFQTFCNSKLMSNISPSDIRDGKMFVFPVLLFIICKTNKDYLSRAIIAKINEKMNKYFNKNKNLWLRKYEGDEDYKKAIREAKELVFRDVFKLKHNWTDALMK